MHGCVEVDIDLLGLHTHISYRKFLYRSRNLKPESAVDVGRYTVDGALFDDGSADDGIAGVVNDNAVDRVLRLSEDSEGGGCRRIGS